MSPESGDIAKRKAMDSMPMAFCSQRRCSRTGNLVRGHGRLDVLPHFITERPGEALGPVDLVRIKLVEALLDWGVAAGEAAYQVRPALRQSACFGCSGINFAGDRSFYLANQLLPVLFYPGLHLGRKA